MPVVFSLLGPTRSGADERYVRVGWSVAGFTVRTTFGLKVSEKRWSSGRGRVKGGDSVPVNTDGDTAGRVNAILNDVQRRLEIYEKNVLSEELAVTGTDFDEGYFLGRLRETVREVQEELRFASGMNGVGRRHALMDTYLHFLDVASRERNWTKATLVNYRKLIPYLREYAPKAYVEDLGLSWMERFFRKVSPRLTERTVRNIFVCLRSFVRWAHGCYGCAQEALQFSCKTRDNIRDIMYLDVDELGRLAALEIPADGGVWEAPAGRSSGVRRSRERIDEARDMFLFCCLTGLRFSDMQRLEWVHVFSDSIRMHTQKTMKAVCVNLNPLSRAILDKMANNGDGQFVFPRISNAEMNRDLKIIGNLLSLDGEIIKTSFIGGRRVELRTPRSEALTTHAGRHTFAVQALSSGVPGSVLMSWTGHSDYNSLKPYIGITSNAKKEAMDKFEQWLDES